MISDFIFDGKALSDFGYIAIQQNSEDTPDVSAMKLETIKGARTDRSHRVGYNYEQNYTTSFEILKNFCEIGDDFGFLTDDEISELTRWLARKQYKWFREIDDNEENTSEIWYLVQNTVTKEYMGADVVGLVITIEASTPYGFTKEIKQTRYIIGSSATTEQEDNNIDNGLVAFSDEEGYIYPDIVITCYGDGILQLKNTNENRTTEIKNCTSGEIITILGGDIQQITSSINHDFTDDFNYVFPRFCVEYDNYMNGFEGTLSGSNAKLEFKYRGIRKVGM